jgi:hypothetical protein
MERTHFWRSGSEILGSIALVVAGIGLLAVSTRNSPYLLMADLGSVHDVLLGIALVGAFPLYLICIVSLRAAVWALWAFLIFSWAYTDWGRWFPFDHWTGTVQVAGTILLTVSYCLLTVRSGSAPRLPVSILNAFWGGDDQGNF